MGNASKVAVFLDIQNLYHSGKTFCNGKISYKELLEKIKEGGREIGLAKAYAAHKDGKMSKNFYRALEALNIIVVSRKVFTRGTEEKRVVPIHFDVEITTDALTVGEDINTVVLCSGNGNFAYMVKALIETGVNVEIWSFKGSTSQQLIEAAGKFVEIPKECLVSLNSEKEETSA